MKLSVIIPVFNEEASLPELFRRLEVLRGSLAGELEVEYLFVNDGSRDRTPVLLYELANAHRHVKVLSFSRNFGHQIAVTAGLDHAQGDYDAIIDADLQDPPELIKDMYALALQGYDVVYGQRRSRKGESWFKRASARAFYRLLSYMCEIEVPADTGDFRIMSRRAVSAFRQLRERHRFVRGMVPWLGFRSVPLLYDRDRRHAGETKYPLGKMISFATNAILSFSRKPLALAARLGLLTVVAGVLGAAFMIYLRLFTNIPVPGLTAVLVTIVIFGGVQLVVIGVLGEYIARIFEEVKGRPLYILDETRNI